jgi:hypothetical protein
MSATTAPPFEERKGTNDNGGTLANATRSWRLGPDDFVFRDFFFFHCNHGSCPGRLGQTAGENMLPGGLWHI